QSRLLAASSPTGPAFEGAQISAGQRAAPGAIERVRIDPETLEPKVKVIGNDLWSDDPAFDAQVTGLCGSGIIEVIGEMVLARLVTADGIIDGEMASRTSRIEASDRTFSYTLWDGATKIQVTQDDIRAIQLAKGALTAGWRLLMDIAGLQTVSRTVLSGAFGAHIDPLYAMILGMVPDGPLETIIAAGNAAGTGARLALVNGAARREIEDVVRKVEKIETATEAKFQDHFVDAMAFPNKAAPYTHLRTLVDLPAPVAASKKRRRRR
ncbi:MAG: ATP-binding protein, partial [Alphaproteobacteria bacterium]|nr:ATP-binding protein [Alphaproteobacteria bacterium]